ncbi:hypothetical protein AWENTII_004628 [Aspergillus wentii]
MSTRNLAAQKLLPAIGSASQPPIAAPNNLRASTTGKSERPVAEGGPYQRRCSYWLSRVAAPPHLGDVCWNFFH